MTRSQEYNVRPAIVADVPTLSDRRVAFDAPWQWLAAGWQDMWQIPRISLTYGGVFAMFALALVAGLWWAGSLTMFLALAGAFLLGGPVLAVGLCAASQRLQRGEDVTFADVALAGFAARGQLGLFGGMLLLIALVWLQLAFLLLMLFFGPTGLPPVDDFARTLLMTPRGLGLLVTGTLVGGMLAVLVYAISVISVPLLLISQCDVITAASASVRTVLRNPKPMLLWAALIVAISALGLATLLAGLIIAFPLLGHASWHAFTDILGDPVEK